MHLNRRRVGVALSVVLFAMSAPGSATAQEGFPALCALLTHQARIELEDLELAVATDVTRLEVDERIFALLDELWQNELIERLIYQAVKHRRDSSAISVQVGQARVSRQQAVLEQHRLACREAGAGDTSASLADLQAGYDTADCSIRQLEVQQFEVDLAYQQEVLTSARNLRQSDIASVQQVLTAERDVDLTQQRLELAMERAARCAE